MDHFDDDENVKAMRETAREVGLTQLLIDVYRQLVPDQRAKIMKALELLGVSEPEAKR